MNPYMATGWYWPQGTAAPATAPPVISRPLISEADIQRRMYLHQVEADLRERAAIWQEYKLPDQKYYYYNSNTHERTWEKPLVIQELDDAIASIKEQKARKAQEEAKAKEGKQQGDVVSKVGTYNNSDAKKLDDTSRQSPQNATSGSTSSPSSSKDKANVVSGQAGGGKQSMKPVSINAVMNTPWCVVWTDKGRVFFFNPSTKTSVWERPAELRGREDVDKMVNTPPANLDTSSSSSSQQQQKIITINEESQSSPSSAAGNSQQPGKKVKLDINISLTSATGVTSTAPKVVKKEVASEIEKEAAKKRETIPIEERVQTFRDMLVEKEVNPTSTFQRELSKIVFDPRYLLLTSSERRETFEKFCKEKIEEEQRKRREKIKLVTSDFKTLLSEANLTSRSTFEEFHDNYSKDPRYKALEKTKDREILFDDHLAYLRRKEREERSQQNPAPQQQSHHYGHTRNQGHERRSHSRNRSSSRSMPRDEAEAVYQSLLVELISDTDLDWHDAKRTLRKSPQWSFVDILPRDWMENVFEQHLDKIYHRRKEKFHALLGETKEVTLASEWRDIKRVIRDDPRYIKFCTSDRRCEREFREFIKRRRAVAEKNFRELLRETKLIDSDTRRKIEESEHQHLIDIIGTLQSDARYVELEPVSEDRRKILLSYIEELATSSPQGGSAKDPAPAGAGEVLSNFSMMTRNDASECISPTSYRSEDVEPRKVELIKSDNTTRLEEV